MTDHDDIERIAAEWVARRDRGPLSADEQVALRTWLEASVANRVSFLRLDATWASTERMRALDHGAALQPAPPAQQRSTWSIYRTRIFAGVAAVLLVACIAGWYTWQHYSQPVYQTGIGVLRTVSLADGSSVTLNTNSAIRTDLSGPRRTVDLQRGEVFFEVSHDSTRPFRVRSGMADVEVVGTRFAVHRTDKSVNVLVSEGRVRVRPLAAGTQETHATDLAAGDIAALSASGIELRHASRAELEDALSWRTGMVVFRDTPLLQAVTEFNRYTATPIVIVDPQLADLRVGGTFRTTNAAGFLRLLEQAFEIEATPQRNAVVLTRR